MSSPPDVVELPSNASSGEFNRLNWTDSNIRIGLANSSSQARSTTSATPQQPHRRAQQNDSNVARAGLPLPHSWARSPTVHGQVSDNSGNVNTRPSHTVRNVEIQPPGVRQPGRALDTSAQAGIPSARTSVADGVQSAQPSARSIPFSGRPLGNLKGKKRGKKETVQQQQPKQASTGKKQKTREQRQQSANKKWQGRSPSPGSDYPVRAPRTKQEKVIDEHLTELFAEIAQLPEHEGPEYRIGPEAGGRQRSGVSRSQRDKVEVIGEAGAIPDVNVVEQTSGPLDGPLRQLFDIDWSEFVALFDAPLAAGIGFSLTERLKCECELEEGQRCTHLTQSFTESVPIYTKIHNQLKKLSSEDGWSPQAIEIVSEYRRLAETSFSAAKAYMEESLTNCSGLIDAIYYAEGNWAAVSGVNLVRNSTSSWWMQLNPSQLASLVAFVSVNRFHRGPIQLPPGMVSYAPRDYTYAYNLRSYVCLWLKYVLHFLCVLHLTMLVSRVSIGLDQTLYLFIWSLISKGFMIMDSAFMWVGFMSVATAYSVASLYHVSKSFSDKNEQWALVHVDILSWRISCVITLVVHISAMIFIHIMFWNGVNFVSMMVLTLVLHWIYTWFPCSWSFISWNTVVLIAPYQSRTQDDRSWARSYAPPKQRPFYLQFAIIKWVKTEYKPAGLTAVLSLDGWQKVTTQHTVCTELLCEVFQTRIVNQAMSVANEDVVKSGMSRIIDHCYEISWTKYFMHYHLGPNLATNRVARFAIRPNDDVQFVGANVMAVGLALMGVYLGQSGVALHDPYSTGVQRR